MSDPPSPVEVRFRGALPKEVRPTAAFDAATALGRAVHAHFGAPCAIVVNANRQRILWWRNRHGQVEMSVHWALLSHADDVLAWLRKEEGAVQRLRAHLPDSATAPERKPLPPARAARGQVHDLAPMLAAERARWAECPEELFIEWGDWPRVAPRQSLRLGSCLPPRIRIHPVLDHPSVPGWFVGFIVFHEVLHVRCPPERGPRGRRRIHTPTFRAFERVHPDHDRAEAFERSHVGEWLSRCRAHVAGR
ncbi:MAG: hypothetical protein AAF602_15205 [Myxococcota bacterium]